MALKEKAMARTAPPGTGAERYQPPDNLLRLDEIEDDLQPAAAGPATRAGSAK